MLPVQLLDCACGHPGLRHYALGHLRNAGPCKESVCPCRVYQGQLPARLVH